MCICIHTRFSSSKMTICWVTKRLPYNNFQIISIALAQQERTLLKYYRQNQHCSWYCNHNVYSPNLFSEQFLPNREDTYIMILLESHGFQSLLLSGNCYEDRSRNEFFISIWLPLIRCISTACFKWANSRHFNTRIIFKLYSTHWYHPAWRYPNNNMIQTGTREIH